MARKTFKPLDFSGAKTYPLKQRFSKVNESLLGKKPRKGIRLRS